MGRGKWNFGPFKAGNYRYKYEEITKSWSENMGVGGGGGVQYEHRAPWIQSRHGPHIFCTALFPHVGKHTKTLIRLFRIRNNVSQFLNKGVLIYKPLENFWLNHKRIIQLQAQLPELLMITTQSKLMYVLKGRADDPAIACKKLIMLWY